MEPKSKRVSVWLHDFHVSQRNEVLSPLPLSLESKSEFCCCVRVEILKGFCVNTAASLRRGTGLICLQEPQTHPTRFTWDPGFLGDSSCPPDVTGSPAGPPVRLACLPAAVCHLLLPQHLTQTSLTWSTIEVGIDQEPGPRAQMVTGFDPPGIQTWVIKKELGSYRSLTKHSESVLGVRTCVIPDVTGSDPTSEISLQKTLTRAKRFKSRRQKRPIKSGELRGHNQLTNLAAWSRAAHRGHRTTLLKGTSAGPIMENGAGASRCAELKVMTFRPLTNHYFCPFSESTNTKSLTSSCKWSSGLDKEDVCLLMYKDGFLSFQHSCHQTPKQTR